MTLEEWQTVTEGTILIRHWTNDEYIVLQPIVGDERMGVQRHRLKHMRSGRKLPPTSDYSLWELKR